MTTYTVPAGRYGDYSTAFIQAYIDAKIAGVLDSAPETLDTLNELAAALGDDPAFLTTMASANTTLQTNIDTLSTAAATARTTLQTLLQNAVDAVQADVDTNETTSASAVAAEATARGTAITNLQTTLQGLIDAVQADVDANELASDNAETALSGRLDTLEADPTTATALATVQADVDANETASDAAETALSNRLDVLEADPTTKTYVDTQVAGLVDSAPGVLNTLDELAAALGDDANFATTITNSIAAVQTDVDANEVTAAGLVTAENTAMLAAVAVVQADVDANETASDAAEAALSTRLDTLEADPTTATAVAAVQADVDSIEAAASTARTNLQTALQNAIDAVQADVDTNEADADTALSLRAALTGAIFSGDVTLKKSDGSAVALKLSRTDNPDMNTEWKVQPSYVSIDKECLSIMAGSDVVASFDERQRLAVNTTDPDYTLDVGGDGNFSTNLTVGGAVNLTLTDAANDSAAASAGVAVGALYRNGSVVMIRVS